MSLNFVQLKNRIGDWLDTDETRLSDTVRGDIINLCVREFLRKHETRFGEHTDFFQTQKQIRDYPVPTGFARPRNAWYINPDNNKVVHLCWKLKSEFDVMFPVSGLYGYPTPMGMGTFGEDDIGMPEIWTVYGPNIQLGKVPNSVFTVFVNFWRYLPDLTDAAPSNDFTEKAWDYLLFASLVKAVKYGIEDERIAIWQEEAKAKENDLVLEHGRASTSARGISVSSEPG